MSDFDKWAVSYMRSHRFYPFLGAVIVGPLLQAWFAWRLPVRYDRVKRRGG
jgi:hypothetical protein